jgi:hypothetical protein
LEREEGLLRALDWLEAKRRAFRLGLMRFWRHPELPRSEAEGLSEKDYTDFLRHTLRLEKGPARCLRRFAAGMMHELLAAEVRKAGLDPHLGARHRAANFGFCRDLLYALDAELDGQAAHFMRDRDKASLVVAVGEKHRLTPAGMRAAARGFERRRPKLTLRIQALLDDFHRLLREVA